MPSFTIGHKRSRDFLARTRNSELAAPVATKAISKAILIKSYRSSHIDRVMGSLRVPNHSHIMGIHPVANTVDGLD